MINFGDFSAARLSRIYLEVISCHGLTNNMEIGKTKKYYTTSFYSSHYFTTVKYKKHIKDSKLGNWTSGFKTQSV